MNINFTDLEKLIHIAENADIHSLEVINGDQRIQIICEPSAHTKQDFPANHASSKPKKNLKSDQTTVQIADQIENQSFNQELEQADKNQVVAPMLGTFYRRPEPSADEFVQVGDMVKKGQTLCVIEAMKIMHEVKAERDCTIKAVLIEEGEVVEYGQPLFDLD